MQMIENDEEYGSFSGYVVNSHAEQPENYLCDHTEQARAIAKWLKENCESVAILKNLNVDENQRGRGYGNDLLGSFMDEAASADAILLISDSGESQNDGFVLDKWYEGWGFFQVMPTSAGSLMVYPEELGMRMQAELSLKQAPSASLLTP